MAEWYERPPPELYNRIWFWVGSTNDFIIGIYSFPAWRSALQGQCGEQAASLLVAPMEKALSGIPPYWCGRQVAGNFLASSL